MIGNQVGCESMLTLRGSFAKMSPAIYHPLTSVLGTLPTGQTVTISGSGYSATEHQGIPCVKFPTDTASNYFRIPFPAKQPRAKWNGAFSLWFAKSGLNTNYRGFQFLYVGKDFGATGHRFAIVKRNSTDNSIKGGLIYASTYAMETIVSDGNFHHVAFNCTIAAGWENTERSADIYVDGQLVGTQTQTPQNQAMDYVALGANFTTAEAGWVAMSALRVWNRHLSADEIAALASEFTPQTEESEQ